MVDYLLTQDHHCILSSGTTFSSLGETVIDRAGPVSLRYLSTGRALTDWLHRTRYTYELPTGNQTYDPSRDLSTTYNFLNLPATFTLADGTELHYVYAADGSKLRESHVNPDDREELLSQRDYIGPTEYEDGVLSVIHHPDGRFVPGGECVLRKHVDGEIDEPTHEKADEIDADATVGVGGRLTMVAGSFTDLRPGFHVPVGGRTVGTVRPLPGHQLQLDR